MHYIVHRANYLCHLRLGDKYRLSYRKCIIQYIPYCRRYKLQAFALGWEEGLGHGMVDIQNNVDQIVLVVVIPTETTQIFQN